MSTTAPHESASSTAAASVASALTDVGAMWAAHGLRVARSALLTSARSLHTVARAIDSLASSVEHEPREAIDVPAAPEP